MGHPRTPVGTFGAISTRRNPNGTVTARTRFRDQDGKSREITATGPNAKSAERDLKARIATRAHSGAYNGDLTPQSPFPELAKVWLEMVRNNARLKTSTKDNYEWNLEHYLLPEFQDFTIAEMSVQRCERYLQKQTALSANKGQAARKTLSLVLGTATRFGLLPANPIRECSKLPRSRRRPNAFTLAEIQTIRAAIQTWRTGQSQSGPPPDGQLAVVVDLMLATSGRIGEVLGLRRCDIDVDTDPPRARIHGTMIYPKKGKPFRQDLPKTDSSRREVALPSWAADSLRDRMAKVPPEPEALVFFSRNGTPMRACNVRRLLRQIASAIGMQEVHPHKFRRTAATQVAREGNIELASKLLGHTNSTITVEHYIEPLEQVDTATADILEVFGTPKGHEEKAG